MYMDRARIFQTLDELHRDREVETLLHGAASGADLLSVAWADKNGLRAFGYPANWGRDGKSASRKRNERIITEGRPDMLVAFPGGPGTAELIGLAKSHGIPVKEVS
jgi:hypothetical protein